MCVGLPPNRDKFQKIFWFFESYKKQNLLFILEVCYYVKGTINQPQKKAALPLYVFDDTKQDCNNLKLYANL